MNGGVLFVFWRLVLVSDLFNSMETSDLGKLVDISGLELLEGPQALKGPELLEGLRVCVICSTRGEQEQLQNLHFGGDFPSAMKIVSLLTDKEKLEEPELGLPTTGLSKQISG